MSNPIKLKAYTFNASAYRYAKPEKAVEFKPEWYKELPVENDKNTLEVKQNMRFCYGFNSLFSKGVILPMWNEVRMRIGVEGDVDYNWQFADGTSTAAIHSTDQRGRYLPETQYSHVKLHAPWKFVCDEGVEFMYMYNSWLSESPEDVVIPAGVVEYNFNHDVNVNIMMRRRQNERFISIPIGTPMVHIIPLSERPLEIEHILITEQEYQLIHTESVPTSFGMSIYKNMKNKLQSGCPFAK